MGLMGSKLRLLLRDDWARIRSNFFAMAEDVSFVRVAAREGGAESIPAGYLGAGLSPYRQSRGELRDVYGFRRQVHVFLLLISLWQAESRKSGNWRCGILIKSMNL